MSSFRIVRWNGPQIAAAENEKVSSRMTTAVSVLETEVKRSMVGGGDPHVPSSPGEPPHVDTGDFRRRIHSEVEQSAGRVVGRVISGSRQATALELGYAPGGLAPRPYLRPALAKTARRIFRILAGHGR